MILRPIVFDYGHTPQKSVAASPQIQFPPAALRAVPLLSSNSHWLGIPGIENFNRMETTETMEDYQYPQI
jgi:hypothetical protein